MLHGGVVFGLELSELFLLLIVGFAGDHQLAQSFLLPELHKNFFQTEVVLRSCFFFADVAVVFDRPFHTRFQRQGLFAISVKTFVFVFVLFWRSGFVLVLRLLL